METITLTLEATPENARKIAVLLSGAVVEPNEVVIPPEKLKEAIEKKAEPKDPTVPETMEAPEPNEAQTPEPSTEITKTLLRTKGVALTKEGRSGEFKELLKKFGTEKLSGLKEADYPAFYDELLKLEAE